MLVFDGETRGLGVRVTSAGTKTFLVQYTADGVKRRARIGEFGILTLKDARQKARALLGNVADGRDPVADKRQATEARKAAAIAEKAREQEAVYTFALLVDGWQAAREGERRPSYVASATSSLRRHLAGWLDRPASSITPADAIDALDRVKAEIGPIAANRTLAYGRAAFGWAQKRGRLPSNPMAKMEATRETARDRVLSRDEVGAIWRAAGRLSHPYGGLVRLLLLTLQRRDEVAAMTWNELDNPADPATWTLPASRAKNGKAHLIHLSDSARAIIASMPRIERIPFVFPSERGRPASAFSAAKRKLLQAMADEAPPGAREPVGWVFHDFRRTGVTVLADMGFPPHVADKVLNHQTGAIQGVAAVYQRAEFLAERRAALNAWSQFVLAAAEQRKPSDNVVPVARPA